MKTWQLQEAKRRLSELVKRVCAEGPQEISLRGDPVVVVMSCEEFKKIKANKPSLAAFMQTSPLKGVELNLGREKTHSRDVEYLDGGSGKS